MKNPDSLRTELKKEILSQNTNFAEFSRRSGVNRGVFSLILNPSSPKPISLNQLETIGKALNKESGWLFELYVEECFFNGKPNRRRIEPFLIRCAELGKADCINQVLLRLKEDPKYVDMVFEIAETLYLAGKTTQPLCFYEFVINNSSSVSIETLATSHYRVFRITIGKEHEKNLRIMIRFEPYCEHLPIAYQLDAFMKMIDLYYSLNQTKRVDYYAKKLFLLSDDVYEHVRNQNCRAKDIDLNILDKPLIVYYGYSLLAIADSLIKMKDFKKAYAYLSIYEDLSWFEVLNENDKLQVARFASFAEQNRSAFELLEGKVEVIENCMRMADKYPQQTLVILIDLLEAANTHGFDIKAYTDRLFDKIEAEQLDTLVFKNEWVKTRYHLDFYYEQALYYIKKNNYEKALHSIKLAAQIADEIKSFDNRKVYHLLLDLMEKQAHPTSPNK